MRGALIDVVVDSYRELTPRIREYRLRRADGLVLPPSSPGDHIELHTTSADLGAIVRHYSIIGGQGLVDDSPNIYRIAVQRENHQRGSAHIHETFAPGTNLQISRPIRNFPLDFRDHRTLLIAGGIGITPIYAMARSLVRRGRDFQLVYVGKRAGDLAYADEVANLCGERARFHYSASSTPSRLDVAHLLANQSEATRVYVCGPASMIEAVHLAAASLGWSEDRVRSERFGAGPSPDDMPFEVQLKRSGRTIGVRRDASILDALTGAGVDLLSDCRRGECGLCAVPVCEAEGGIDHRDRYFDEAEHAKGAAMCICVSRARGSRLVLDI
jgi:dimethylamine monooxygenase subunit B